MTQDHPFRVLFESFGRMPLAHAEVVNQHAYRELCRILAVPLVQPGACTLLRAPRAGHGKTHLLSRLRHRFESTHDCILLRAAGGYQVHAGTVIEDVLRHLFNGTPGGAGVDELARRLLALGLAPLVESGQVPSQDRERALEALREHPLETLNFQHAAAMTAHWLRENYEVLSVRLSAELARECGLPTREIRFWLDLLYAYTASEGGVVERQERIEQAVLATGSGEAVIMTRLEALLGLMTLVKRVVLIADDLEGFSTDSSAALRFASFVMAMRQSVQRLEFVLSLNQDVWDGVFVPCLSDGLTDRLSERLIELQPLTEPEMVALLECRAPGSGGALLPRIDRGRAGSHARGVIREAAAAWQRQVEAPVASAPAVGLSGPLMVPSAAAGPAAVQHEEAPVAPIVSSPAAAAEAATASAEEEVARLAPADRERVDEMLRQFRERFGQVSQ